MFQEDNEQLEELSASKLRLISQQHSWYKKEFMPEESEQNCADLADQIKVAKERVNKKLQELNGLQDESKKCDSLMRELNAVLEKGLKSAEKITESKKNLKSSKESDTLIENLNVS